MTTKIKFLHQAIIIFFCNKYIKNKGKNSYLKLKKKILFKIKNLIFKYIRMQAI